MPLQTASDAVILEDDTYVLFRLSKRQSDTLVCDRAVSRTALKGFVQPVGRGGHIIYKSHFSEIVILREMEPDKVVADCLRNEVEKFYLLSHFETSPRIGNLLAR